MSVWTVVALTCNDIYLTPANVYCQGGYFASLSGERTVNAVIQSGSNANKPLEMIVHELWFASYIEE